MVDRPAGRGLSGGVCSLSRMARRHLVWWTITACFVAGCGGSGGQSAGGMTGFSSHGITVRYPSDWSSEDGASRAQGVPTPVAGQIDWAHSFHAPDGSAGAVVVTGQQPIVITQSSLALLSRIAGRPSGVGGKPTSVEGYPALALDGPYMSDGVPALLHAVMVYKNTAGFGFVCLARDDSSVAKHDCDKFAASFEVHPSRPAVAAWSNLDSPDHGLKVSVPPHWVPNTRTPQPQSGEGIAASYTTPGGFVMGVSVAAVPFGQRITVPLYVRYVRAISAQFHRHDGFKRLRMTKLDPTIGEGVWLLVGSKSRGAGIYIVRQGQTMLTLIHPYDPQHAAGEAALRPTYDAIAATMSTNH